MGLSSRTFFGDAAGAFARSGSYPDLPDLDILGDPGADAFSPPRGAAGFTPYKADIDQMDHLAERAEKVVGQAREAAQAALSSTLSSAREYAPELKAMSDRALASAGETGRRATSALASPKAKAGLLVVGGLVALLAVGWMAVPFVAGAVRSGIVQGVALAVSSAITSLFTGNETEKTREAIREPGSERQAPPPRQMVFAGPAQAVDTATVTVEGKVLPLAGIAPIRHEGAVQGFGGYLTQAGPLRCEVVDAMSGAAVCLTGRGVDIAETAVLSGMATATPDAGDKIHRAQREAKQNRAGIWGMQ